MQRAAEVGIFTVRALNIVNHLPVVIVSSAEYNIITCLQNHRFYSSEVEIKFETGNDWTSAWKNSVYTVKGGIKMLLSRSALK